MTFRQILVPVDFSHPTQGALEKAVTLLQTTDGEPGQDCHAATEGQAPLHGELHVLYVVDESGCESEKASTALEQNRLQPDILPSGGFIELGPVIANLPHHLVVRKGRPARVILDYAEEMHADLIVMSARRYSATARASLGHVTEDVVRHAPCPVLSVREQTGCAPVPAAGALPGATGTSRLDASRRTRPEGCSVREGRS